LDIDPAWVFLAIGLLCGIILIVLMLMGGMDVGVDVDGGFDMDHDVGHDIGGGGPSPLSMPVLLSFGTMFGISGFIIEIYYGDPVMAAGVAAVLGAMMSGIMYLIMVALFRAGETSTDFKPDDVVGEQGEITIPIEKGNIGQVMVVTEARGRTLITATSDQNLPMHTRVNIVGISGDRVIVEPAQGTQAKKETKETKKGK
jgi:membrane protein implicated in regulation of membrane protease activity